MRSDESFTEIVATSVERITRSLLAPRDSARSTPVQGRTPAAETLGDVAVERLGHGNYLVVDDVAPPEAFHLFASRSQGPGRRFAFKGTLPIAAEPVPTLNVAYRLLLDREADSGGLASYVPLLRHGPASRKRLLRLVLASKELLGRSARFVIVPDTSAWLGALAQGPHDIEIALDPDL